VGKHSRDAPSDHLGPEEDDSAERVSTVAGSGPSEELAAPGGRPVVDEVAVARTPSRDLVTVGATAPSAPAPNEPAPNAPAPNEPAPNEPAPHEPAPNEPAPNEPAPNEPAPNAPAPNEPAAAPVRAALPPVPSFRASDRTPAPRHDAPVTPGRAARRQDRTQRSRVRRRAGLAGVVALALLAVAGSALLVREATRTAAVPPAPVGRTQVTVLLALGDGGPTGDEAALLAGDPVARTASVALLPSRTLATVTGRGQLPLGKAVATRDTSAAAAAVSDLLGVTVDGVWRLAPETFAGLIDTLGGVTVDVDRDVTAGGAVVLHAGPGQHLGGASAVAFAQSLDPSEDETARLARLQTVLDAVIAALPGDPAKLATTVAALGGGSEVTLPPDRLTVVLSQLVAARTRSASPVFSILPVTTLEAGGDTVSYRVEEAGLRDYVQANLAASVPPGARAGAVRVFVVNGTLEYGVGTAARQRLVAAGLSFVDSKNDTQGGRQASAVLVRDATDASRHAGERVAAALGLPTSAVQVAEHQQDAADVVVITGADFHVAP